jgi:hypothetical protein
MKLRHCPHLPLMRSPEGCGLPNEGAQHLPEVEPVVDPIGEDADVEPGVLAEAEPLVRAARVDDTGEAGEAVTAHVAAGQQVRRCGS